jgi:hydrogenase maturation protease
MSPPGARGVLVAGVGNVFCGDDGFGPAVVDRLLGDPAAEGPLPPTTRVVDYGIRGVHLSFDLLDGWDTLLLVDALPGADPPGTLHLLEVTEAHLVAAPPPDAHRLDPFAVLSSLRAMGGQLPPRTLVLGCTPASTAEGMGLSRPVAAAVAPAATRVRALAAETAAAAAAAGS